MERLVGEAELADIPSSRRIDSLKRSRNDELDIVDPGVVHGLVPERLHRFDVLSLLGFGLRLLKCH